MTNSKSKHAETKRPPARGLEPTREGGRRSKAPRLGDRSSERTAKRTVEPRRPMHQFISAGGMAEIAKQAAESQRLIREMASAGGLAEIAKQAAESQRLIREMGASGSLVRLSRAALASSFPGVSRAIGSTGGDISFTPVTTRVARPTREVKAVPAIAELRGHVARGWERTAAARRLGRAVQRRASLPFVVLAADIRHSTILMKEAVDLYRHAEILGGFAVEAREIVLGAGGIFDKFMGDGFLALWQYTNGTKRAQVGRVLSAMRRLFQVFAESSLPAFEANSQSFLGDVGLSVGLDEGLASLVSVADEPGFVGPAVVGAVRMASAAKPWQTLANVQVAKYIQDAGFEEIELTRTVAITKEYEQQVAYLLSFTNLALPVV